MSSGKSTTISVISLVVSTLAILVSVGSVWLSSIRESTDASTAVVIGLSEWSHVEALELVLGNVVTDIRTATDAMDLAEAAANLDTVAEIHEQIAESATVAFASAAEGAIVFDALELRRRREARARAAAEAADRTIVTTTQSQAEAEYDARVEHLAFALEESGFDLALDSWRRTACARSAAATLRDRLDVTPEGPVSEALDTVERFLDDPEYCFS